MKTLLILLALFSFNASAEIGKVLKLSSEGAYLIRNNEKINLSVDQNLELGDEIHSARALVVLYLYPATQISLNGESQIILTESVITEEGKTEQSSSIVDFIKGMLRAEVTKGDQQNIDQKIKTKTAAFAVRGTEFEVSILENDDVDLDVIEGVVEASSPLVNSFVPEYVKANEGLRLSRKEKKFSRRKFALKFKKHPGFEKSDRIKARWKKLKAGRKARKVSRNKKRRNK